MPEAFKGCLVFISNLSDAALEDRISTVTTLLEAIRRQEKTATSAYRKCALSAVDNYLWLLEDQARSEWADRRDQKELERCRQILAEVVPPSQEKDNSFERKCDHDRLLKNIEDTKELIRLRQSAREAVEGQLSALSAIQIDSYLNEVGVPAHDPIRLSINGQSANVSKATENQSEPSLAQSCKTFAAETFIDLTAKYPRGVPKAALEPFAAECDARTYMLSSEFLRLRVCRAIEKYNDDHPRAKILNFSDLVAALSPTSSHSGSVKKRHKNSAQTVAREFRVWLYEMKRDYLREQQKRSK